MNKHTKILIATIALITTSAACGAYDPCDKTNPLFPHLSPMQQQSCDICGELECSMGTSGDDSSIDRQNSPTMTCPQGEVSCYDAELAEYEINNWLDVPGGLYHHQASDCNTLSVESYRCARGWNGQSILPYSGLPDYRNFGLWCASCELGSIVKQTQESMIVDLGDWPLCQDPGNYFGALTLATISPSLVDFLSSWPQEVSCLSGPSIWCEPIQIWELEPSTRHPAHNITCGCRSDDDCQPGAACEAGWVKQYTEHYSEMTPYIPTICTWDDGSGTANGAAPDGPIVYGIDGFASVLSITRRPGLVAVEVALPFAAQVLTTADPWNDDQRFSINDNALEITHCGPESLCGYVGLAEGDSVTLDHVDWTDLAAVFDVSRLDGSSLTLTVEAL